MTQQWKLVRVNAAFDDLMYWLERCERKGHLDNCADLIEPWEAFDYEHVEETPPASAQDDAKDAERYRTVRQSVADEANGADQISAAGEAIGLRPGAYPTPEQFDAMIDHIAASQQQEG